MSVNELVVCGRDWSNSVPPFVYDDDYVRVFTDGSCNLNAPGKPGGWATLLLWRDKMQVRFGHAENATNNTMELTALLRGFQQLNPSKHDVIVLPDSQYAMNCVSKWYQGWVQGKWINSQGKPVANQELVKEAYSEYDKVRKNNGKRRIVMFQWVKGHQSVKKRTGNPDAEYNHIVDEIAGEAMKKRVTNWDK